MCAIIQDVHAFLLDQFNNREGTDYVKSRAYAITDASGGGGSVIQPSSWKQAVRGGMTLEMSIVVRRHLPLFARQCPWCEWSAPDEHDDGWLSWFVQRAY